MKYLPLAFSSIIKHIEYPSCINCIHFIKYNVKEYDYHPEDKAIKLSTCNKFGSKDIISGKINYDSTSKCRFNKDMCGLDGKYFISISKINKIEL